MTVPTGEAAPTEGSAPAPRQRPVRRALDDLGLVVTAEHVERIAAEEPAWLADDRRAAFTTFKALPGESNRLYTPYIDLRSAQLADAAIAIHVGADDDRSGSDAPEHRLLRAGRQGLDGEPEALGGVSVAASHGSRDSAHGRPGRARSSGAQRWLQ